MQIENLSWFPGHMTKTKRMIVAEIGKPTQILNLHGYSPFSVSQIA